MGLGLYRDRLLHFGGMLRTEVEDGTWMLYARDASNLTTVVASAVS